MAVLCINGVNDSRYPLEHPMLNTTFRWYILILFGQRLGNSTNSSKTCCYDFLYGHHLVLQGYFPRMYTTWMCKNCSKQLYIIGYWVVPVIPCWTKPGCITGIYEQKCCWIKLCSSHKFLHLVVNTQIWHKCLYLYFWRRFDIRISTL